MGKVKIKKKNKFILAVWSIFTFFLMLVVVGQNSKGTYSADITCSSDRTAYNGQCCKTGTKTVDNGLAMDDHGDILGAKCFSEDYASNSCNSYNGQTYGNGSYDTLIPNAVYTWCDGVIQSGDCIASSWYGNGEYKYKIGYFYDCQNPVQEPSMDDSTDDIPSCSFNKSTISKDVAIGETASFTNSISFVNSSDDDYNILDSGSTSLFEYGGTGDSIINFKGSNNAGTYKYTLTAKHKTNNSVSCSTTVTINVISSNPTTCDPNQFLNNGVCENCPTGSTSAGGTVTKCDCPSGKTWIEATKKCVDTSDGDTGITCSAGKYLPANGADSGDCETCLSGYYCTGGTFERSGSNQGLTRCSTLGGGSYTSSLYGATKASDCYIPKANLVGKYVFAANSAPVTCPANYYCRGSSNINYGSTGGRVACPDNGTSPAGSDEESDCTSITKFCHDNGYYATETEAKNGTTINYGGTSKCSAKEGYRLVEDVVHPSTAGYTMCYIKKCTYTADTITCNASNKMYYTSTQAADAGDTACTLGLKSTPYDADTKCYTYECKKAEDSNEYSVEFKNATTLKCTPVSENGEKPKCSVIAPTTATCSSGEFLGWSSASAATTVSYAGGSTITVRASTTFYPVCKAGGLGSVCSYVGENLDTYIVTRKTQFLNCKYVNIMWNGQPATEDEKNACCRHKGWTFVPQGGLDYEYCIKCGTKTCDSKNNEYATEAERDAAIFNNCKYGNRKWTASNGCYKYECEGAPSSEDPSSSGNSSIKPSSSTPSLKPSSNPSLPPDNPDTGNTALYIIVIVGILLAGYSVWYYKNAKEE